MKGLKLAIFLVLLMIPSIHSVYADYISDVVTSTCKSVNCAYESSHATTEGYYCSGNDLRKAARFHSGCWGVGCDSFDKKWSYANTDVGTCASDSVCIGSTSLADAAANQLSASCQVACTAGSSGFDEGCRTSVNHVCTPLADGTVCTKNNVQGQCFRGLCNTPQITCETPVSTAGYGGGFGGKFESTTLGTTLHFPMNACCGDYNYTSTLTTAVTAGSASTTSITIIPSVNTSIDLGFIGQTQPSNTILDQFICNNDGTSWKWLDSLQNVFTINHVDSKYDAISNGNNWFRCDPNNVFGLMTADFSAVSLPYYSPPAIPTSFKIVGTGVTPPQIAGAGVTLGSGATTVAAEDLLTDVSLITAKYINTIPQSTSSNQFLFTLPSQLTTEREFTLNITGSNLPIDLFIRNATTNSNWAIRVSNSGSWEPTNHAEVQLAGGTGTVSLRLSIPTDLQIGSHDLNITISECTNPLSSTTCKYNSSILLQNAFEITNSQAIVPASQYYQVDPARFFCHGEQNGNYVYGRILECCGPNFLYCLNDINNSRISGEPTALLEDFNADGLINKNYVLRGGFTPQFGGDYEDTFSIPFGNPPTNLKLNKWNLYNFLEFDIYLLGSPQLKIALSNDTNPANLIKTNSIVFDDDVLKYSTSGTELGKWHHIKIPLTSNIKAQTINKIWLHTYQSQILSDITNGSTINYVHVAGTDYIQFIGLDKFYLSSNETKFCGTDFDELMVPNSLGIPQDTGATKVGRWISDLDQDRDACNNVASYKWTSTNPSYSDNQPTHCCGDDVGYTLQGAIYVMQNPGAGLIPIYRTHDTRPGYVGNLYYTTNTVGYDEHYDLIHNFGNVDDGVVGYVYSSQISGTIPLREFQPAGYYHDVILTTNTSSEYWPNGQAIWSERPIMGYVYPSPVAGSVPLYKSYNVATNQHLYSLNQFERVGELYSDSKAACWRSLPVLNNTLAKDTVLYMTDGTNGNFSTCLNPSFKSDLQSNITSGHVENVNTVCQNLGSWYCDADTLWKNATIFSTPTKFVLVNTSKTNPTAWPEAQYVNITFMANTAVPASGVVANLQGRSKSLCCPASFCYDGITCIDSDIYTQHPKQPPVFMTFGETGYRCNSQGNWTVVSPKFDFNQQDKGYCELDSDCFATSATACLHSDDWNLISGTDRYCYNGNWTTRMKYVASALLEYAQNYPTSSAGYSMFCDDMATATGESLQDFRVSQTKNFQQYIAGCSGGTCISGFCLLKMGDNKVLIGAALNLAKGAELNSTANPVYEAFGFTAADAQPATFTANETKLIYSSSKSGKLYYSKSKQTVFYTIDGSMPGINYDLGEAITYYISHPIITVTSFIKSFFTATYTPSDTISQVADFNKVYVSSINGKEIVGLQETKFNTAENRLITQLSINYTGFTSDICGAVASSGLSATCNSTSTSSYVFYSGSQSAISGVWPDFTAKLRVS